MKKRVLAIFAVVVLLISCVACGSRGSVPGENSNEVLATAQANSSATVIWTLYSDGEMVFSGAGKYQYSNHDDFRDLITKITFKNGITELSNRQSSYVENGFEHCNNLTAVYLPISVQTIQAGMFDDCPALTDIYFEGTQEQWSLININEENSSLLGAEIHYNAW